MARITVEGDNLEETFDDDELDVSYRAEFTSDNGVAVHVDLYRGSALLVSVPIAKFGPDEANGFREGS